MVAALLGTALGWTAETSPTVWPGHQPDGSVLLPNQWSIKPVGSQVKVGDFPVNLALHPDGLHAAVLHSGYGRHEIRILDLSTRQVLAQLPLDESFYGLAWSPDGTQLYASGAGAEVIHVFDFRDGVAANQRELHLRNEKEVGVPSGLAVSADGGALYVAEAWGQRVLKVAVATGQHLWERSLGEAADLATTHPEGVRWKPSEHPDAPFPYTCVADEKNGRVYVSLWAKAAVLVLDSRTGAELARWPVGEHPNEMVLGNDGRLFVAESNRNSVSVIDVREGKVTEKLSSVRDPATPPGSMPESVALSPDGQLLFVANATNNNLAVFDVREPRHSQPLGFIPVGWFPTSVRVSADGKQLIIANGKGVDAVANPLGPFPGDTRPRNLQQYIGGLLQGTVTFIDLPAPADRLKQFAAWTQLAYQTGPRFTSAPRPEHSPLPAVGQTGSPLRYVIYIIKENRTYDQVLGDLGRGNGDPSLCLFGEEATPNLHALAREFITLDNFYADGEVSSDGHEWSMAAYATDFVEKSWPLNYGHNKRHKVDYPSEGHFPVAYPANGYLWNRAAEAGVSYRSYGEFVDTAEGHPEIMIPSLPVLRDHIDPGYRSFDLDYTDVKRAARFAAEIRRFEAEGDMPRLQVLRLGNDHTVGTRPGQLTPTACVADNDLALGQIVESVSHSKFWDRTAIFVLEDDAQSGPDHVDAHRIPAFVICPYTRRHATDSSLYSTSSMLHTIELILGLQPMSQYDAAAQPMYGSFQSQPDLTPYSALAARTDLNARNPQKAWGAKVSLEMDFREADRADDLVLNEVVWHSVKGADHPMPAPVRAAFLKALPSAGGDDDDD